MSDLSRSPDKAPLPKSVAEPTEAGKTPLLTLAKIATEYGAAMAPAAFKETAPIFDRLDPGNKRAQDDASMIQVREETVGGYKKRKVTVFIGPQIPSDSDDPEAYLDYPKLEFNYRPGNGNDWDFYAATVGIRGWEIGMEKIRLELQMNGVISENLIDRNNYLNIEDIERQLGRFMPKAQKGALISGKLD